MMEEQTDERSMYKYLCGTPYWMETLEASLAGVSIALPISLDSVPIPSPNKLIIQQKTTKTLGRPALKRRASNMDCFQSGSVKKTKQTILFKENLGNCLSPIQIYRRESGVSSVELQKNLQGKDNSICEHQVEVVFGLNCELHVLV